MCEIGRKAQGVQFWRSASPLRLQQPSGNNTTDRRNSSEYLDS
jgi:hypothetical protein